MEDRIRLSYFYGKEADQFSFYKIPKLLFTEEYFKKISVEAKVLYGLMLDRMSLSMKNQWMDDEGRAYIYYSLEDIMEALGCSNKKAISIMKELDTDAGIGLIEKKRQGQGKPTMIYLKQFMVQDVQKCRNFTSEQKAEVSEVKNLHILKCKNAMSRSEEITLPEVKNIHTNKNNINNTELCRLFRKATMWGLISILRMPLQAMSTRMIMPECLPVQQWSLLMVLTEPLLLM